MDFKRLLQLVHTYSDDVQALLEAGQAAALRQQQEYVQQLTADAAAVVGGSIESALAAAHKAHQQQVTCF
jgi:heptaprenylglyceryl phosphate synthase